MELAKCSTASDILASVLNRYENVTAITPRNRICEVGGTYTMELVWIIGEESRIGLDIIEQLEQLIQVPLTEEQEIQTKLQMRTSIQTMDELVQGEYSDDVILDLTDPNGEFCESKISKLKQLFSEVHLTDDELIQFVQLNGGGNDFVEFIEVSSYDAIGEEVALFNSMCDHEALKLPETPGGGLHFYVNLGGSSHVEYNGICIEDRFGHVQTLNINGRRYPITIETDLSNGGKGWNGQWIHTSDQLAENTLTPSLSLSEELDRIEWSQFLSSTSPWPEHPGAEPPSQSQRMI